MPLFKLLTPNLHVNPRGQSQFMTPFRSGMLLILQTSSLAVCMCVISCGNWSTVGQGSVINEGGKKLEETVQVGDHIDEAEKKLRQVGLGTGVGVYSSETAGGLTYRIEVDYGANYWSAAETAMRIWEDLPPGRSPCGFVYADEEKIVYRVQP